MSGLYGQTEIAVAGTNPIINPHFTVDQPKAYGVYTVNANGLNQLMDCWAMDMSNRNVASITARSVLQSDFPNMMPAQGNIELLPAVAEVAPAANETIALTQYIEGFRCYEIFGNNVVNGKNFRLSFDITSTINAPVRVGISLYSPTFNQVFVSYVDCPNLLVLTSLTNAPFRANIVFPGIGFFTADNTAQLQVRLHFCPSPANVGTNPGQLNQWADLAIPANGNVAPGVTNFFNNVLNRTSIGNVEISPSNMLIRDVRDYITEYALCKRYYQKSFARLTAPAQAAGLGGSITSYITHRAGVSTDIAIAALNTDMRATPALTTFNPVNANANWYNQTRAADSGIPILGPSPTSINLFNPQVAADAVAQLCSIHWVANARLS